ncbi:MAG: hypothetical protein ACM3MK_00600 [Chitinophagales bacterium]
MLTAKQALGVVGEETRSEQRLARPSRLEKLRFVAGAFILYNA